MPKSRYCRDNMIDMLGIADDVPIIDAERARELDQILKEYGEKNYSSSKMKYQQFLAEPDKIDSESLAGVFTTWYFSAIILFIFGNIDTFDDIFECYFEIRSRSEPSGMTKIAECLFNLLPLTPIQDNNVIRRPFAWELRDWIHENRDKLSWDEAKGKYVL